MGTVTPIRTTRTTTRVDPDPTRFDLTHQRAIFDSVMREPTDAERLESVEREARTRGRIEGSLVMAMFVVTGLAIGSFWAV